MQEKLNLTSVMRQLIEFTDSTDEALRSKGFAEIARLAAELPENAPGETGFLDNALFCARKHASDTSEAVRRAVTRALGAIGARNAFWREAALETADEIALQPSDAAKQVAEAARTQTRDA